MFKAPMLRDLSVLTALAFAVPTATLAQQYQVHSQKGPWTVFYNAATKGCFMERQGADQVVMQIGTEAALLGKGSTLPFGFIAIYVPDSMGKGGEGGEVVFDLGRQTFSGTAVGVKKDGFRGGYVVANNPLFAEGIADQQKMVVFPQSENPLTIDLTGTSAAMAEVRACQAAHPS